MVSINKIVTCKKGEIYHKGEAQWKRCTSLRAILHFLNLPHPYGTSSEKEQKYPLDPFYFSLDSLQQSAVTPIILRANPQDSTSAITMICIRACLSQQTMCAWRARLNMFIIFYLIKEINVSYFRNTSANDMFFWMLPKMVTASKFHSSNMSSCWKHQMLPP